MLGSYRGIIFAIVGWLALLGAGNPPQPATKAEQSQASTDAPQARDVVPPIPTESPEAVDATEQQQPCGQSRYESQDDLCAQWKAADAARDAADWAKWQLWLSGLGIMGLVITLWFNFEAWRQAREGKTHTDLALAASEKNAAAATKLAEVAENTARAELRPYLDFDGVRLDRFPDHDGDGPEEVGMRLRVNIRNYGKTPARNVEATCHTRFVVNSTGFDVQVTEETRTNFQYIAPSDVFHHNFTWRLPEAAVQDLERAVISCRVCSIITYTDAFGDTHVLRADFTGLGLKEDFGVVDGTRVAT